MARLTLLQQADDYAKALAEKRQLENFYSFVGENDKEIKVAIPPADIFISFEKLTRGAVKRLNTTLFVDLNNEIKMFESPKDLFAYLSYLGVRIVWSDKLTAAITKGEFHGLVQLHATRYDLVSELPCYPQMPGIYYTKEISPKKTDKLDLLVEYFAYASDVDRQLIKAMFMTPFWGGECGQRPAFLVDGLDSDGKGNRGIGKTTITDALVELCGGSCVDLTSKTDGEDIRKRLLTAYKERVVRMDNIKSQTLSNETLESLITSKRISGHQMFHGHNSIPNAFTYVLTFNDAVLSKDMSQRCIIIRLKRPIYRADWWDSVVNFINKNRDDIIADIGHIFQTEGQNLPSASRFPKWEKSVLAKCTTNLLDVQKSIQHDQENADDDSHLRNDIRELIVERISAIQWKFDPHIGGPVFFDPEKHTLAINRTIIYRWVAELFQKGSSSRYIAKRFHSAMPIEFLPDFRMYLGTRYLIWSGARGAPNTPPDFAPRSCWRVEINGREKVSEWHFSPLVHETEHHGA